MDPLAKLPESAMMRPNACRVSGSDYERKNLMTYLRLLALGVASLALAATSPTAFCAPPHTGIQGQAFLYISNGMGIEIAPGIWVAPPSVQLPIATSLSVVAAHSDREVARITTDANGLYSLPLHPGDYRLVPDTITLPISCPVSTAPIEVTVRPGKFAPVNIFYFRFGFCSSIVGNPLP